MLRSLRRGKDEGVGGDMIKGEKGELEKYVADFGKVELLQNWVPQV